MKVKFKLHDRPTRLARAASTRRRGCDILFGKSEIGSILDSGNGFHVSLMVIKADIMEDGNPNTVWKNVILTKRFSELDHARDFVRKNWETIKTTFDLYFGD